MRMNWTTETHPDRVPVLELAWDKALVDISYTAGLISLKNLDERLRDALSFVARHGEMDSSRLAKAAVAMLHEEEQIKNSTTAVLQAHSKIKISP
jgi:hypothetical protein